MAAELFAKAVRESLAASQRLEDESKARVAVVGIQRTFGSQCTSDSQARTSGSQCTSGKPAVPGFAGVGAQDAPRSPTLYISVSAYGFVARAYIPPGLPADPVSGLAWVTVSNAEASSDNARAHALNALACYYAGLYGDRDLGPGRALRRAAAMWQQAARTDTEGGRLAAANAHVVAQVAASGWPRSVSSFENYIELYAATSLSPIESKSMHEPCDLCWPGATSSQDASVARGSQRTFGSQRSSGNPSELDERDREWVGLVLDGWTCFGRVVPIEPRVGPFSMVNALAANGGAMLLLADRDPRAAAACFTGIHAHPATFRIADSILDAARTGHPWPVEAVHAAAQTFEILSLMCTCTRADPMYATRIGATYVDRYPRAPSDASASVSGRLATRCSRAADRDSQNKHRRAVCVRMGADILRDGEGDVRYALDLAVRGHACVAGHAAADVPGTELATVHILLSPPTATSTPLTSTSATSAVEPSAPLTAPVPDCAAGLSGGLWSTCKTLQRVHVESASPVDRPALLVRCLLTAPALRHLRLETPELHAQGKLANALASPAASRLVGLRLGAANWTLSETLVAVLLDRQRGPTPFARLEFSASLETLARVADRRGLCPDRASFAPHATPASLAPRANSVSRVHVTVCVDTNKSYIFVASAHYDREREASDCLAALGATVVSIEVPQGVHDRSPYMRLATSLLSKPHLQSLALHGTRSPCSCEYVPRPDDHACPWTDWAAAIARRPRTSVLASLDVRVHDSGVSTACPSSLWTRVTRDNMRVRHFWMHMPGFQYKLWRGLCQTTGGCSEWRNTHVRVLDVELLMRESYSECRCSPMEAASAALAFFPRTRCLRITEAPRPSWNRSGLEDSGARLSALVAQHPRLRQIWFNGCCVRVLAPPREAGSVAAGGSVADADAKGACVLQARRQRALRHEVAWQRLAFARATARAIEPVQSSTSTDGDLGPILASAASVLGTVLDRLHSQQARGIDWRDLLGIDPAAERSTVALVARQASRRVH